MICFLTGVFPAGLKLKLYTASACVLHVCNLINLQDFCVLKRELAF